MPGKHVINGDGTWTTYPEDYVLKESQTVLCDEDDPRASQKLTKYFGVKIKLPPYQKVEKDIPTPVITGERSIG